MKNLIRQNLVLATGIGLPIIVVIFFLLASTLPRFFIEPPAYDFLFTNQRYEYNKHQQRNIVFKVKDGKLQAMVTKDEIGWHNTLYHYDHKSKSVSEIDIELHGDMKIGEHLKIPTVEKLNLAPTNISPDGYTFLANRRGGGGIFGELFYDPRGENIILKKDGHRISIPLPNDLYANRVDFIGWVTEQEPDNG